MADEATQHAELRFFSNFSAKNMFIMLGNEFSLLIPLDDKADFFSRKPFA